MAFSVGDAVSIKGQSNSKVTVAEVGSGFNSGKYRVQNSFQSGAKGTWMHGNKLVAYGESTGAESPMGGRASNPDAGRSSVPTNHWLNR